jgi:hypothetical protein
VWDKLSARDAATMMELLPPVGWADVATKRDLDHLREVLASKDDLRAIERELRGTSWRLIGVIGAATAVLGLVLR